MTAHERATRLATAAIDWPLTPAEQAELDQHVASCSACRATARTVISQAALLRSRPRALAPAGMEGRVALAWGPRGTRRQGGATLRLLIVGLAILALLSAVVLAAGRHAPNLLGISSTALPSPDAALEAGPTVRPADAGLAALPAIGTLATFRLPIGQIDGECTLIVTSGCSTDTILAFDSLWTTSRQGVERVAPDTGRSLATIPVGGDPIRLLATDDAIWATVGSGSLVRIDPLTSEVVGSVPIGRLLGGLASFAGAIWVADIESASVVRVEPRDMRVGGRVALGVGSGVAPWSLAATGDALWVTDRYAKHLVEIDPATMTVARSFDIPAAIPMTAWDHGDGLVASEDRVYVASGTGVAVFDPTTGEFRTTPTPLNPNLALAADRLWLVSSNSNVLVRLDPATLAPLARQVVGLSRDRSTVDWEVSIAADDDTIWLQSYRDGLIRITLD